jgi:hypothetical protein
MKLNYVWIRAEIPHVTFYARDLSLVVETDNVQVLVLIVFACNPSRSAFPHYSIIPFKEPDSHVRYVPFLNFPSLPSNSTTAVLSPCATITLTTLRLCGTSKRAEILPKSARTSALVLK